YGSARKAPAVLVVPSLINRYYVLDLLPEQSFLCHLAASGLRPFVVDWGEPGAAERDFTLSDYIAGPLDRVLTKARDLTRGPVTIIGYCMGGLLALALALRRPSDTAARGFVALEDWINDGVPLAHNVAVECLQSWYGDNAPARGEWRVGGQAVRAEDLAAPTLVVLPRRDRIVPPRSAAPLATAIPQA